MISHHPDLVVHLRVLESLVEQASPQRVAQTPPEPIGRGHPNTLPAGFEGCFHDVADALRESGSFHRKLADQMMSGYGTVDTIA